MGPLPSVLLVLGLAVSCTTVPDTATGRDEAPEQPEAEDPRDALLIGWLRRDNAPWAGRDPALLAGKYRRMAADPYDFMRGTNGLFHEDIRREPGAGRLGYATGPQADRVLLVGDPHPENLSTFLPLDEAVATPATSLTVAWADMDAASFGPWIADVRRGAAGLLLFVEGMPGCHQACRDRMITAYAHGYDAAIRASAVEGAIGPLEGALRTNPLVADLLAEAAQEGAERRRLGRHTMVHEGARFFRVQPELPMTGRGHLSPSPAERALVDGILARHAKAEQARTGRPFRVLDVTRRYGQGVSSWPATRFVVLWDTGQEGAEDDRLLNLRELVDPPAYIAGAETMQTPWTSNAERVLYASRRLWPQAALDPRLAVTTEGGRDWKMMSYTSWYQGLDHDKATAVMASDEADLDDLIHFSHGVGAALGLAHGRGKTEDGSDASSVILADLGTDPEGLAGRLTSAAGRDRVRILTDHARFVRLLADEGAAGLSPQAP